MNKIAVSRKSMYSHVLSHVVLFIHRRDPDRGAGGSKPPFFSGGIANDIEVTTHNNISLLQAVILPEEALKKMELSGVWTLY